MSFQRLVENTAKIGKWRIDQQLKIVKAQNGLKEINNQIDEAKRNLANIVYDAYKADDVNKPSLFEKKCGAIEELINLAEIKSKEIKALREEVFIHPITYKEDNIEVSKVLPSKSVKKDSDVVNNICTKCGEKILVRFCQNCGYDSLVKSERKID